MNYFKLLIYSLLIIATSSSCVSYDPIELESITEYEIQNLENNEMDLVTTISVKNPNKYIIELKADSFNLFLNDSSIGTAYIKNDLALVGNSTENYVLRTHLVLKYDLATTALKFGKNPLEITNYLQVKGQINAKAKWVEKDIDMDEKIPLNMKDLLFF